MEKKIDVVGDSGKTYSVGRRELRVGVTSLVKRPKNQDGGGKHFVLLDYDDLTLKEISTDVRKLMRDFNLPSFYIFRTSNRHYSAFSFKVVNWEDYKTILFHSNCCVNFRYYTVKSRLGTIRLTEKKEKKNSSLLLARIVQMRRHSNENFFLKNAVMRLIGFESPS